MAEDNNNAGNAGQQQNTNAGQQQNTNAGQQQNTEGQGAGSDGKPFDPERAKATIDKLRGFERQSKDQAKELEATKARLKELEDAKLSDTEKLQGRVAELESKESGWQRERQELLVRSAAETAAGRAGALHPDAVYKLLDFAELTFGDDGAPTNLDKLIEATREAYPSLFRASPNGSADGGARGGASGGTSMNDLIRRAAGRS